MHLHSVVDAASASFPATVTQSSGFRGTEGLKVHRTLRGSVAEVTGEIGLLNVIELSALPKFGVANVVCSLCLPVCHLYVVFDKR